MRPQPAEVLFERVCRENGITQRRTRPRSTTTGKIELFHKTLRAELLDHVALFETLAAAQDAVDSSHAARSTAALVCSAAARRRDASYSRFLTPLIMAPTVAIDRNLLRTDRGQSW